MRTVVRIANPESGGKTCTSGKRALMHIKREDAVLLDDGTLFFYRSMRDAERRVARNLDREIGHYRSGVVYWNGAGDPMAKHQPGEVRS